jgi:hypothetical protein
MSSSVWTTWDPWTYATKVGISAKGSIGKIDEATYGVGSVRG